MKQFILFLVALFPFVTMAQFDVWFPKMAVTDSAHENKNASIIGQYNQNLMFWDQQLNDSTTQLCYKNIIGSTAAEQQVALYQAGVNLTHPKIINLSNGTQLSDYIVIYQTDEGNDIDLKAIVYQQNGSFSSPIEVASLPGDDLNASVNESGMVAWENGGKVWVSHLLTGNLFSVPFAIDSLGSYSPVFSSNMISYLKTIGDSSQVVSEELNYNQGVWEVYSKTTQSFIGTVSNLSYSGSNYGRNIKCMQNKIGTKPSELILLDEWNTEITTINSPVFNFSQPAIADYMMAVKSPWDYILAYVSDSLGQNEIFVQDPFNLITNISQWPGDDIHPSLSESFPDSYIIRVHLLWESMHSGFSTIYYSHYDYLFGGTKENPGTTNIQVEPCPFHKETTIKVQLPESSSIQVFNLQGNKVKTLKPQNDSEGWSKAIWDGTDSRGSEVAAGNYLILASYKNTSQSRIVIKE